MTTEGKIIGPDIARRSALLSPSTIGVAIAFILGLIHALIYRAFQPDDTFIYLTYVKNFVLGNGFTYNGELVEGYSGALWTFLVGILSLTHADPLTISKLIGWASYLGIGALLLLGSKYAPDTRQLRLPMLLILFAFPPLALWASGAMETVLFTLTITAATLVYYGGRVAKPSNKLLLAAGLLFGLTSLSRPEGFALIGIVPAFEVVLLLAKRKGGVKSLTLVLTPYLVITGSMFLVRHHVYGLYFPVTVGAKTGNLAWQILLGKHYIKSLFRDYPLLLPALVVSVVCIVTKRKADFLLAILLAGLITGYVAFCLLVGGDWMLGYRFLVPVIPASILLITLGFRRLPASGVLLLILAGTFVVPTTQLRSQALAQAQSDEGDIKMGKYIASLNLPKTTQLAVIDAGAIAYYSGLPTIDMIGLNNAHIAMLDGGFLQKYDNEYVLKAKPDIVQFHTFEAKNGFRLPTEAFRGSLVLFFHPEFQRWYELDTNSPVAHLYRRLPQPKTSTFLETYYDAKLSAAILNPSQIQLNLVKTGAGTWAAQAGPGQEAGKVYIDIKIIEDNSKVVYQVLTPLKGDMATEDQASLTVDLPKPLLANNHAWRLVACPTLLGVSDFPACSESYLLDMSNPDLPPSKSEVIAFNSPSLRLTGWSLPEASQIWSLGNSPTIEAAVDTQCKRADITLNLSALGVQRVGVHGMGSGTVTNTTLKGEQSITLKDDLISDRRIFVQLDLPDALSPGADPRKMGVALKSLTVKPGDCPE